MGWDIRMDMDLEFSDCGWGSTHWIWIWAGEVGVFAQHLIWMVGGRKSKGRYIRIYMHTESMGRAYTHIRTNEWSTYLLGCRYLNLATSHTA